MIEHPKVLSYDTPARFSQSLTQMALGYLLVLTSS